MIGVDWGTTSFPRVPHRARRHHPRSPHRTARHPERAGQPVRRHAARGDRSWLAAGEDHVLLSGMIGSRQGWKEAPYLPCPAGAPEIAAALVEIEFDWAQVKLVPGLSADDEAGVPR